MESNPQSSGSNPPQKPWERAGQSSGSAPFKPPSSGNTSDIVEASGTANPGEVVSTVGRTASVIGNTLARPVPTRPWEQPQQTTFGGGFGSGLNSGYGAGVGAGMYGSSGGYGGGLYGNNMYRGGYGGLSGGGYGGLSGGGYGGLSGGGMYGGGMYNTGGFGGSYGGGYGMGMGGGPYGEQDPNNPFGASPGPPGFWISLMRVMSGVVGFFGRVAMLIDQNTQALHMFMNALLQLLDRSGLLYGELARFVLRLLGIRTKPKNVHPPGPQGLPGPNGPMGNQNFVEGPKAAPNGSWDGLWGNNANS